MGVNQLPALADYWKLDPTYRPIANRITRDRFLEISRYLHFVDKTLPPRTDPTYDKLGKIQTQFLTGLMYHPYLIGLYTVTLLCNPFMYCACVFSVSSVLIFLREPHGACMAVYLV